MSVEREIAEEPERWVVTEKVKSPMGEGQDRSFLAKDSLVLIGREVQQGPATVEISLKGNKASGTMNMGGQDRTIDLELGGAVFADGAGAYVTLAALPLAEGFTTTYRNLDLMRQKEKLMKLVVAAVETVTVPAGTFEAWRLDVASAEGDPGESSVWIARDSRKVVKAKAVVPEMGGATVTSELTP